MTSQRTICPYCKRSLRNINAWHYCKEVEIDDLFINKSDEILLAFDRIMEQVSDWQDVEMSGTKNCIVFVRNKTFLVVKPMTKFLEVKFYSKDIIEDEDLHKCELWSGKYQGIMRFQNEHQVRSKYIDYIRNSYEIS